MSKSGIRKNSDNAQGGDSELKKFKELLGATAKEYSEVQLRQLRQDMVCLANLLLDLYLTRNFENKGRNQSGSFDSGDSAR